MDSDTCQPSKDYVHNNHNPKISISYRSYHITLSVLVVECMDQFNGNRILTAQVYNFWLFFHIIFSVPATLREPVSSDLRSPNNHNKESLTP